MRSLAIDKSIEGLNGMPLHVVTQVSTINLSMTNTSDRTAIARFDISPSFNGDLMRFGPNVINNTRVKTLIGLTTGVRRFGRHFVNATGSAEIQNTGTQYFVENSTDYITCAIRIFGKKVRVSTLLNSNEIEATDPIIWTSNVFMMHRPGIAYIYPYAVDNNRLITSLRLLSYR